MWPWWFKRGRAPILYAVYWDDLLNPIYDTVVECYVVLPRA